MATTPILIGGAAGVTGNFAARQLLEGGFPVRALVRSDDERAQKLKALGAEVFTADLLDFRAIRRAFDGVKRAYFVYPMRPGILEACQSAFKIDPLSAFKTDPVRYGLCR